MSCFSTVSFSLTCNMERSVQFDPSRRSLSFSLCLSVSFSQIPPLLFSHLSNTPSLDSIRSVSHIFVIFVSLFIVPLICFFLFPPQAAFPPLRSSFFLHLARLCPPIFFLFICSCVWIELSTSASGEGLKKTKRRKKNQTDSHEQWPLRVHHKLDSKHEGPSPRNLLFSTLFEENGAALPCTWARGWKTNGFMGAHYLKRRQIRLVWPVWRCTNCVSLKRMSSR